MSATCARARGTLWRLPTLLYCAQDVLLALRMTAEVVDTLVEVAAAGFAVYCAQSGKTAGWDYAPPMRTDAELSAWVADGWRTANVWIARDMPAL